MKKIRGVSLIVLVITIIVMTILASVIIISLDDTNIIEQAENATNEYNKVHEEQQNTIDGLFSILDHMSIEEKKITEVEMGTIFEKTTKVVDEKNNAFVVPAKFAIVQNTNNMARTISNVKVTDGIVITDAVDSSGKSIGNEYVWIPVGNVTKDDGTIVNIELKRRMFAEGGTVSSSTTDPMEELKFSPTAEQSLIEESGTSSYGVATAKDIQAFIASAKKYGGYYIGRYEAGIINYDESSLPTTRDSDMPTDNSIKSWSLYDAQPGKTLEVVCKANMRVWNYISQPKASELARNMYSNSHVLESDLMNSFALDTAFAFIQAVGDSTYAGGTSGKLYDKNTDLYNVVTNPTGTIGDVQCNIYDLSGNLMEWTTETYTYKNPCIYRGAGFNGGFAGDRSNHGFNGPSVLITFRPILYYKY